MWIAHSTGTSSSFWSWIIRTVMSIFSAALKAERLSMVTRYFFSK